MIKKEVLELLGIGSKALEKRVKSGKIRVTKSGKYNIYSDEDVYNIIEEKSITKKFNSLKLYKSSNPLTFAYIPILDTDPKYSANYMTRADLIDSYELLKEVFEEIANDKIKRVKHRVLADTICFSKENFHWYSIFVKEASRILNMKDVEIPYYKCPDYSINSDTKGRSLIKVHQPFGVYYNGKRKVYFAEELKSNRPQNDPINNYRLKYILSQYELEEFTGNSYPSWYSLDDLTIYEKYCTKTNTRIRVDFKEGDLHYFIAGASDNWKEILNVPDKMKYVIYALLFRTMDVDTNEREPELVEEDETEESD